MASANIFRRQSFVIDRVGDDPLFAIGGVHAVFHRARLSCAKTLASSWAIFVVDSGGFLTLPSDVEDPPIHDTSYCTFFFYNFYLQLLLFYYVLPSLYYPKLNERFCRERSASSSG